MTTETTNEQTDKPAAERDAKPQKVAKQKGKGKGAPGPKPKAKAAASAQEKAGAAGEPDTTEGAAVDPNLEPLEDEGGNEQAEDDAAADAENKRGESDTVLEDEDEVSAADGEGAAEQVAPFPEPRCERSSNHGRCCLAFAHVGYHRNESGSFSWR
jgi:hypothetical protein